MEVGKSGEFQAEARAQLLQRWVSEQLPMGCEGSVPSSAAASVQLRGPTRGEWAGADASGVSSLKLTLSKLVFNMCWCKKTKKKREKGR